MIIFFGRPSHVAQPPVGQACHAEHADLSVPDWLSRGEFEKYRSLSLLDKFYIYTDYVPREMGSWKYRQDNQPEVIVGMQLRPDGEYFPSCRDRRYLLHGYAVCDDFYSPDYSHRPLPETKDYRRTPYGCPRWSLMQREVPRSAFITTASGRLSVSRPWALRTAGGICNITVCGKDGWMDVEYKTGRVSFFLS